MKKIIISIFIVILIVIAYFMLADTFKIGNFSIKNIKDIQALDEQLNKEIINANKKITQEYANGLQTLKNSIEDMAIAKEKYETYNEQGELGLIQINSYKIEYLWAIIGQYAKDRNTQLTLDLVENGEDNLYNLNFTLIGDYTDIIDCMSDIEDDDSFDFKITNFEMKPYTQVYTRTEVEYNENQVVVNTDPDKTTIIDKTSPYDETLTIQEADDTTVASSYNPKRLIATFQVENVGIQFN